MTWGALQLIVDEMLTVDANRRGTEALRARAAKNCAVDLQRFIRGLRVGHSTTYQVADLTTYTKAMLGAFPVGAIPQAFYTISTKVVDGDPVDPNCHRNRMDFWPWLQRSRLICGQCDERAYLYTIAPYGNQFMIHPLLNDETELKLVWEGIKSNFADGDDVPFPEESAEAFAAYIKSRIASVVDKNQAAALEEMGFYQRKRLALYRDYQERQDAEKPDQEYLVTDTPPVPDESITSWAELAALTTVGLTVPVVKFWLEASTMLYRVTVLKAGTDATDVSNGIQRPDDYDAVTNAVVWYQAGSGA